MNPIAKLAAFAATLAVVFALGLGFGRLVGPFDQQPIQHQPSHVMDGSG